MAKKWRLKRYQKIIAVAGSVLTGLFIIFLILVNRFVEPVLKDRLHTLIIQGSDSLYTYTLGKLKANFYGGNVEIENLQIKIDSNRYQYLRSKNALPSLTMQLSLQSGKIKGVGIFDLLFNKKINIEKILSTKADVKLSRHIRRKENPSEPVPLWQAIRTKISSIYVGEIKFDGIKMLYKNIDTSESVKLQFDRCDATFTNVLIDSAAAADTNRIGFTKEIYLKFQALKFRTSDSTYKMKAKEIIYSSKKRQLEIDSFKLQPTLDKEDFYSAANRQTSLYYIEFSKAKLVNTRLDHFIRNNVLDADSFILEKPEIKIYNDKSLPPNFQSKIGKYPQQQLLKAGATIIVKNVFFSNGNVEYTEKKPATNKEGTFSVSNINFSANNITNDDRTILQNHFCTANVKGTILGNSPVALSFKFYLDSSNGRFDATGSVKNISASQLNQLSIPLANVQINSFDLQQLQFTVRGEDYHAYSSVQMRYNNLALTLRKTNEATGETTTKKFITKMLNRFVIWSSNPGPDGLERTAQNKLVLRLTTDAFFGLLWKSIFSGMQDVMMKSGRYE